MASLNENIAENISLKTVLDFAVQKWWIIYGLGLAITAILLLGPQPPKATHEVVFYPWIPLREKANLLLLIMLLLVFLGSVLYGLKKSWVIRPLLLALITLVFALAAIGPYVGRIFNSLEPDPTLTHVASMRLKNHIYNLARHNAFYEAIGQAYILYECDSLGINCRAIYRYKPASLDDALASEDNAFLASDNANIAVHIAGKVVYTLPASTDS